MVESQVRPSDVTDRRIIRAMLEVPREVFVPASLQALAYMDEAVPVTEAGGGRRRPLPAGAAHLRQARAVGRDRAGRRCAGCGVRHGLLDGNPGPARQGGGGARGRCRARGQRQRKPCGRWASAMPSSSRVPWRRVPRRTALTMQSSSTAPCRKLPQELLEQLKDGGRLVAVIADGALGRALVWTRTGKVFDSRPAFDAGAQPLPGFSRQAEFVL